MCFMLSKICHLTQTQYKVIIFFLTYLEVPEFICVFATCNNSQPVTKIIFLEVFLCKIFEVPKNGLVLIVTDWLISNNI